MRRSVGALEHRRQLRSDGTLAPTPRRPDAPTSPGFFARYAWAFLGFNILVIVWGALVRATGSGAGCGAHWPLCNGVWVPSHPQLPTLIELTHRVMSGLALVGASLLAIWAFRDYPRRSPVRWSAGVALGFMLSEAVIGAGLVLLRLVEHDASLLRAVYLSVHLMNTFLLLAALASTAWWATHPSPSHWTPHWRPSIGYGLGGGGLLVVGISGGIAALGDTLFPSSSLAQGFANDFSSTAHFLIRLRAIHPLMAIIVGLYLFALAAQALSSKHFETVRWARSLMGLVLLQWAIGAWNLFSLAPIALQLLHLCTADALWITWVCLSWSAWLEKNHP